MKIKRLTHLTTGEVSVVRKPANRARVALTKSESAMAFKLDNTTLQTIAKTAVEGEAELIKKLEGEGKNEKQILAQVAMFRVSKSFADQLEDEDVISVAKEAGFETVAKAKTKKDDDGDEDVECSDDEDGDEEDDGDDKPAFGKSKKQKAKKTKKGKDEETAMSKTKKSADDTDDKLDRILKSVDALSKENAALKQQVSTLTGDKVTRTFVAKAEKELGDLPGSAEEIGKVLKSAYDVSDEHGKAIEALLARANKAASEASILTKSIGSANADKSENSAWAQIEKLADDMVTKSTDAKMTKAQAIDIVMKSERGERLYKQYLTEHPEQITGGRG